MNASPYGLWTTDDAGLPSFDLSSTAPESDAPLTHLLGTGKLSAFVDRWGSLTCFTTDTSAGYVKFRDAFWWRCLSELYSIARWPDGRQASVHPADLQNLQVRYGIGYVTYTGECHTPGGRLRCTQHFVAPPQSGTPGLAGWFELTNLSSEPWSAEWRVHSDLLWNLSHEAGPGWALTRDLNPALGAVWLVAPDDSWRPGTEYSALTLARPLTLGPGQSARAGFYLGYGATLDLDAARAWVVNHSPARARQQTRALLAPAATDLACAPSRWMHDEALWCLGQLLSFTNHDSSVGEFYQALGGYGWTDFGVREVAETSLVLAPWFPSATRSALRWVAKLQHSHGDLHKAHNFRSPLRPAAPRPEESDNELWLLLGVLEAASVWQDDTFLDEACPFADGSPASIWDHLLAARRWIIDVIGVGAHGLVRIWEGDWNDYLSTVGKGGRGESVMNTGIACRALSLLPPAARRRGETALADEIEGELATLRAALSAAFVRDRFLYGYTDDGLPFGGGGDYDDRVHLNAQVWAVLGGGGTPSQRRVALLHALSACADPLGLALMSRPYPCPPPPAISWCPIPPGDGENAGVWPQVVHWTVWALAEAGLHAEAETLWRRGSLRAHAATYPDVPYGVFNGPDCYSSAHAGPGRAGRTQIIPSSRAVHVPMSPAIAWQAFSLRRLLVARAAAAVDPSPPSSPALVAQP